MSGNAMAQAQYPYLDLTVMPQIRDYVVSARAAILFSVDLQDVLWLNGEGAQLIGAGTIREALEGNNRPNTTMIRQIAVAVRKLETASEAQATVRLKQGFKTRLLGYSVRELTLPDNRHAVLLVTDPLHGRNYKREAMAQVAVDALDGYSKAAAVLDGNGEILASSESLDSIGLENDEFAALTNEVAREDDRLVKRHVQAKGYTMPAGIARLSDDPALHLLVIADAQSGQTAAANEPAAIERDETETRGEEEQSADEKIDETPEALPVSRFSNRREGTGRNRLNRWYYKKDPEPEPEPVEFLEYEEELQTAEPAEAPFDPTPDAAGTPGLTEMLQPATAKTASAGEAAETQPQSFAMSAEEEDFRFKASAKPVRFVWEMDSGSVFTSVSDELAAAVGPKSADIGGLNWEETGKTRGLANAGEISALLEKGDTWSGKTVLWPVQGTDLRVPIDMAGLPSFDRNRAFDGYSGFGIIRTADAVVDPDGGGLDYGERIAAESEEPLDDFGPESSEVAQDSANIVDIGTRKAVRPERELSSGEQNAFDEIAQRLAEAKSDQAVERPRPAAPVASAAEPFTPSAFAKKIIEEHDNGPAPLQTDTQQDEVDTSILARLPIPVLVYRGNDMLFGNDEFFALTGYADLSDLSKRGGVNALFGLLDKQGEEEEAVIYHRDGSQLNVSAHLQRVPWDSQRAMLLTLRRNGGGPGTGLPIPSSGQDSSLSSVDASPADASSDCDTTEATQDTRPSVENAAPISLAFENDLFDKSVADEPNYDEPVLDSLKSEREDEQPPEPVQPSAAKQPPVPPAPEIQAEPEQPGGAKAFGGLSSDDMRGILDVATDGIVILSKDGTVRAINRSAEALFDVRPNAIEGKSITRLLAPESHRVALDYISGMAGTGVASLLNDGREIIGQTAQGGLIPLFMTIGKLENSDACCAVVRDITHFKKAEDDLVAAKAQAESANALKSDFLAKISHEIRTPLNAIIGFSDLMIEERFGRIDNDRYRGYLRDIRRSGNHVLDLVNDLLDISKIEAGKVDLEFDACELNTIVSEAVALTQPAANKERIIIRTSLSAVVPKVVADPRSISQIVLNIVSNAIKFTRQGGQVIVSTVYDENGEVVLRIRDTGIGMNDTELARAMKPFQQVGPLSGARKEGTGLGLPLTKALVEANRARFHIESTPGEGTLVEIHFPIQRVLADH